MLACASLAASSPGRAAEPIKALLVSDIHFDPFTANARITRTHPIERWSWILDAQPSTLKFSNCGPAEATTSPGLFQNLLSEIRRHHVRFTILPGDLLVHEFKCRFERQFPEASDDDYRHFAEQTTKYVLREISRATAGHPVYFAPGNHDTGCGNYRRDYSDQYLAALSGDVAANAGLGNRSRRKARRSFGKSGAYVVSSIPGMNSVSAVIIDTTPLSRKAGPCKDDSASANATENKQLTLLSNVLEDINRRKRHAILIEHIPPGVDSHATSIARQSGSAIVTYLRDDHLERLISAHSQAIRLIVAGHTHRDEWRVVGNVPVKILPSVTPGSDNLPALSVAEFDREGRLSDYEVFVSHAQQGDPGPWARSYKFREEYGVDGFNIKAIHELAQAFVGDLTPVGAKYRSHYTAGNPSTSLLQTLAEWSPYLCSAMQAQIAAYEACVLGK